jgi:uncharacterized membrane protein YhaH (DUF805 family)
MSDIHNILFLMQTLYSFGLGLYASWLTAREQSLSGNFWGSIGVYVILNIVVLIVGIILNIMGFTIQSGERIFIYYLYMMFLIVIMPGLFSMLRGREDRSASMMFVALALFNASVSYSMIERGLSVWVMAS